MKQPFCFYFQNISKTYLNIFQNILFLFPKHFQNISKHFPKHFVFISKTYLNHLLFVKCAMWILWRVVCEFFGGSCVNSCGAFGRVFKEWKRIKEKEWNKTYLNIFQTILFLFPKQNISKTYYPNLYLFSRKRIRECLREFAAGSCVNSRPGRVRILWRVLREFVWGLRPVFKEWKRMKKNKRKEWNNQSVFISKTYLNIFQNILFLFPKHSKTFCFYFQNISKTFPDILFLFPKHI
jgi:hypothetical protein